jgi:hypothetical protein
VHRQQLAQPDTSGGAALYGAQVNVQWHLSGAHNDCFSVPVGTGTLVQLLTGLLFNMTLVDHEITATEERKQLLSTWSCGI